MSIQTVIRNSNPEAIARQAKSYLNTISDRRSTILFLKLMAEVYYRYSFCESTIVSRLEPREVSIWMHFKPGICAISIQDIVI